MKPLKSLFIKNMVCDRCKATVETVLKKHGIKFTHIDLGEISLVEEPSIKQLDSFKEEIAKSGFELIEDKTSRIISRIKSEVVKYIHYTPTAKKTNFSKFLTDSLHKDYSTLSNIFSSIEGITIERYLILQKIELIKELLVYDEQSLKEIADGLGYSSVPHLSNQFKKITGLSPSHFKKLGASRRTSLDKV